MRNPWDRIVSEYKYRGYPVCLDFKTYLFKHLPEPGFTDTYCHILPQYDFLFDERGTLLVDFVGKYESLQADFDTVCARLGISPRPLPHVNRSEDVRRPVKTLNGVKKLLRRRLWNLERRHTFPHYTQYYDDESREFVAELFRKDIDAFGYAFGDDRATAALRVGERPPELPRGAPRVLGGDESHPGAQVSGAHAPIHDALRVVGAARRVIHPAKPQRVLASCARGDGRPVARGSVPPG